MFITVGDLEKVLFELISMGVQEEHTLCLSCGDNHFVDAVAFMDSKGDYLGGVAVGKAKARIN